MSGKGSGRRPAAVSDSEFASNYDRIFRKPAISEWAWMCLAKRSHGLCKTLNDDADATCGACGADRDKGQAL